MTMYKGELTVLRNALGYEQEKPLVPIRRVCGLVRFRYHDIGWCNYEV